MSPAFKEAFLAMPAEPRTDRITLAECRPDTKITTRSIGKRICCRSCTAVALLWCICGVGADEERAPSTASAANLESSLFTVFAAQRLRANYTEVSWPGSKL